MSYPKCAGIYSIRCTADGQSTTYIGQAVNIRTRILAHIAALRRGQHGNFGLQAAWNIYGEQGFEFSVMERVARDGVLLAEREQAWLDATQRMYPVYNVVSDVLQTRIGHSVSASTRRKISNKAKGRKPGLTTRLAVALSNVVSPHRTQTYPDLINLYSDALEPAGTNCAEFSRRNGLDNTNVRKMLRGQLTHAYGWMPLDRFQALTSADIAIIRNDRRGRAARWRPGL